MTPQQVRNREQEWMDTGETLPIHQFLNMSLAEYRLWQRDGILPPQVEADRSFSLFLEINFPVLNPSSFTHHTDVKTGNILDFLYTFIETFQGSEPDPTPYIEREMYKIQILLDLTSETFTYEHNCGSMDLMVGILGEVFVLLSGNPECQTNTDPLMPSLGD